jgi:hypothetical protein
MRVDQHLSSQHLELDRRNGASEGRGQDGIGAIRTSPSMETVTAWSASRPNHSTMLGRTLFAMSPPSSRLRLPTPLAPLLVLLVFLNTMFQRVEAVRIPFENCLGDGIKKASEHMPLQWVPLYLDAIFDTENDTHNLRVTTWGNVTGSYTAVKLPPPSDPAWTNPNQTDGKIQRTPDPSFATTLVRKVNVLTYEPFHEAKDFCRDALVNGTCPLPPVFESPGL